jgi:hypothetical protein
MFWHPITMILLILTVIVVLGNIPFFKKNEEKGLAIKRGFC